MGGGGFGGVVADGYGRPGGCDTAMYFKALYCTFIHFVALYCKVLYNGGT